MWLCGLRGKMAKRKERKVFSRAAALKMFKEIFKLDTACLFSRWNIIVIGAIIVLLGVLLEDGYSRYRACLENSKLFQTAEKEKVEQYVLYTQYGAYGIRIMFIPSPLSIFFNNSTVFKDMTSSFDSGERLYITNNLKGENLFGGRAGEYMDFSGIILLVGILMALLWGFNGSHHTDYQRFLSGLNDYRDIFQPLLLSRIILFNLVFLVLAALSFLWILIKGMALYDMPLGIFMVYLTVAVLVLSIFITAGFITGTIKKTKSGLAIIGVIYFTSTFLIPWFVLKLAYVNAYNITSNYKLELDKLKLMMKVEKESFEKCGLYNTKKEASSDVKQIARNALKNEFPKFLQYENKMKGEIVDKINLFEIISIFFPTTFYLANNYGLSSQGYMNFDDFYSYNIKRKFQFVEFYSEKKIFKNSNKNIESFIKGDENLFVGKSRLSGHFWPGLAFTIAWLIILYFIAKRRFSKSLFPLPDKKNAYANLDINLKKGKFIAFELSQTDIMFQFFNILAGKKSSLAGKISIDGQAILPGSNSNALVIPNPSAIPVNYPVQTFIGSCKINLGLSPEQVTEIQNSILPKSHKTRFYELTPQEKTNLLLTAAAMKKSRVYVLYDFARGLPTKYKYIIKDWVIRMKEQGSIVIELPEQANLYLKTDYLSYIDYNGETYEEHRIFNYTDDSQ